MDFTGFINAKSQKKVILPVFPFNNFYYDFRLNIFNENVRATNAAFFTKNATCIICELYEADEVNLENAKFGVTSSTDGDTPKPQRIFWTTLEGLVASCLLIGGGFAALQTASLVVGIPILMFMIPTCFALLKELKKEIS